MTEHKVVPLRQKDEIDDPLTEILRAGAKRLIEQAVEAEFAAFLAGHADLKPSVSAPQEDRGRLQLDQDHRRTGEDEVQRP